MQISTLIYKYIYINLFIRFSKCEKEKVNEERKENSSLLDTAVPSDGISLISLLVQLLKHLLCHFSMGYICSIALSVVILEFVLEDVVLKNVVIRRYFRRGI